MKRRLLFPFIFVFQILLLGCATSEPIACYLPSVTASSNSPLITGGSLQLNATSVKNMETGFKWTGPNDFESNLQNPIITNFSSSMAGEYKVKAVKGICESPESSTIVEFTEVPCNPSINNRLTLEGSATYYEFTYVSANNSSGDFEISASGPEATLIIDFADESIPTPGIYDISSNCPSSFMPANEVCVSLLTGGNYKYAREGKVYITSLNGKFTAIFCNVVFQQSPYLLNATVKVTQK